MWRIYKMVNRENKNTLILCVLINLMVMASLSTVIVVAQTGGEVFDITRYDAESNILGFMPTERSGLDQISISEYPLRDLRIDYDTGDGRVLFKIGEWELKEDLTIRDEYILEDQSKLIKSTYYLETDLIAWTDLDYNDVFTDGESGYQVEVVNDFMWLDIDKKQDWGWGTENSWSRATIYDNDLYSLLQSIDPNPEMGGSGVEIARRGATYLQGLDIFQFANSPVNKAGYHCYEGMKTLANTEANWNPYYFNKYLTWKEVNLPGGYDGSVRNWAENRYQDFSVQGDLYFDVNLKESLWNKLKFPDVVEVTDDGMEGSGRYNLDRVVLAADTVLTLGPSEEGSRTRTQDLQEIYNNYYSSHTAEGNWINSIRIGSDGRTIGEEEQAITQLEDLRRPGAMQAQIPVDELGDGVNIGKVIDLSLNWFWEPHPEYEKEKSTIPQTSTLEPYIWENDEPLETVSIDDINNLKPLNQIEKTDFSNGLKIQDRSYAVFKTYIDFGPKLVMDYANLKLQTINLDIQTIPVNLFWGETQTTPTISPHEELYEVVYSANVHNMGYAQTLRLKMIALSTYDYVPDQATGPEVSPDFPMINTALDWPASVSDGGDTGFTQWTETTDFLDGILGWLFELGAAIFGALWWLIIPLLLGLVGVVIYMVYKLIKRIGGGKGGKKELDELIKQQMEIQRLTELSAKSPPTQVNRIEGGPALKGTRAIVMANVAFGLIFLGATFYVLF